MLIFYYFLENNITKACTDIPYASEKWLGNINDEVTINGKIYTIVDYAVEEVSFTDLMEDY